MGPALPVMLMDCIAQERNIRRSRRGTDNQQGVHHGMVTDLRGIGKPAGHYGGMMFLRPRNAISLKSVVAPVFNISYRKLGLHLFPGVLPWGYSRHGVH